LHGFDALTPIEETRDTLSTLVHSGKVRYIACSNFSGWHLMKSFAISEKYGWARYVGHQVYYSLIGREYEWELMPLGIDQGVGALVWSPLGWGRLTGKIRRDATLPAESRLHCSIWSPRFRRIPLWGRRRLGRRQGNRQKRSAGRSQLALATPTVSTVILGARNEGRQLRQNLAAAGWNLTPSQVATLDAASDTNLDYPRWHQRQFTERNPAPVPLSKGKQPKKHAFLGFVAADLQVGCV
jgi:aryl-alcohol dehydrogenase-like predicted oxidoreductase